MLVGRYIAWMTAFIPYYAAGVAGAVVLAATGAPGWMTAVPPVLGLAAGIWRGPRL